MVNLALLIPYFNVKKLYFLIFKKICSIEIFEKIELERYN